MATILVSYDEYYPTKRQWKQSFLVLKKYHPTKEQWQQSLLVLTNITPLEANSNNPC